MYTYTGNMGHFYCLVCDAYLKANKKSVHRHQSRNRKVSKPKHIPIHHT